MIFRAAWSCFLVRKAPLTGTKASVLPAAAGATCPPAPAAGAAQPLLDFGVVAGGSSGGLLQTLVLFVAAVVLLDEHGGAATLLKTLLLVVGPELGLDQNGRLGHLLVQSILGRTATRDHGRRADSEGGREHRLDP